jgi:hypothetical protein
MTDRRRYERGRTAIGAMFLGVLLLGIHPTGAGDPAVPGEVLVKFSPEGLENLSLDRTGPTSNGPKTHPT